MHFLFVSRRNVHARYYKKLISQLNISASIHIFGKPMLGALKYIPQALNTSFDDIIATQIKRKQAKNSMWNSHIFTMLYAFFLNIIECCRYAKYLALFEQQKPTHLVIWNGNKLPNVTVVKAAKRLGINVFYYENGLLPNTSCLDPKGVNFASSVKREREFYENFELPEHFNVHIPKLTPRANHKKRKKFVQSKLPARYIFVPFQVPHDTQIASYSPWIHSMEALYDKVMEAVEELNDPQLKVVFKEHPSWHKHYPHLYKKHPQALFANGNVTADLIENAQAVVTVNSTVGIEALLIGQRVITLGQACYNIDGLVLHAPNEIALRNQLLQVMHGWQVDSHLKDTFFSYLKHVYSVQGRWQDCSKDHVEAVEKRLLGLDAFSQQVNEVKEHNEQHCHMPVVERTHKRFKTRYL
ncbi:capsular biosynthesis protein [Pseudoalteromonas sp. KS88]|uniref:capsular polysaccharide export protein, LipB/KpsS family n=1 Tax=Pseudoalteromonas sp. KS88 TaxID=2109918 RepID=UPI001080ABBB|nr:capsular biosynthesis protein [Pseudoalteromonas sp. KS88]TGE84510.1 capsular biosynthesis protein [Pseudoalteromonas sp. KS88]